MCGGFLIITKIVAVQAFPQLFQKTRWPQVPVLAGNVTNFMALALEG